MPSPLDAYELVSYSFAQLFQRLLSGQTRTERVYGSCLRIQLLEAVRNAALRLSQRDDTVLAPTFRSWVTAGSPWPLDEDGQLSLAYQHLTPLTQCLLWHSLIEREDAASTSRITGLPARSVEDRHKEAARSLRRTRTELYLRRLEREDCVAFAETIASAPEKPLSGPAAEHIANCPVCREIYLDLARLDARLTTQLPPRLLGWWPAEEYRRAKETAVMPLADPPFLELALRRALRQSSHRRSARPAAPFACLRNGMPTVLAPGTARRVVITCVLASSLSASAAFAATALTNARESTQPPPAASSGPARPTSAPKPSARPALSADSGIDADAFASQRGTEPLTTLRPHARVLGDSALLRYEAVDFGPDGGHALVARLSGPVGGDAWLDIQVDSSAGRPPVRVFTTADGSLRDVQVPMPPVSGTHEVTVTAACPTATPCITLDKFGTTPP
ncbi:hypothetical protein ACWCPS_35745 [Streptomyces mauvecolor]